MKRAVLFLLGLSLLLPASGRAQTSDWLYEIRGGVLAHDIPIWAAGHDEYGIGLNAEMAFAPSLPLLGGAIRPVLGGTFATRQGTSWVYLDARWEWNWQRVFLGIGVGAAVHTGDLYFSRPGHKALGSRVLIHVPVEIGVQLTPANRLSIYYEHASNGFLAEPNPGMDNIGLRLARRF